MRAHQKSSILATFSVGWVAAPNALLRVKAVLCFALLLSVLPDLATALGGPVGLGQGSVAFSEGATSQCVLNASVKSALAHRAHQILDQLDVQIKLSEMNRVMNHLINTPARKDLKVEIWNQLINRMALGGLHLTARAYHFGEGVLPISAFLGVPLQGRKTLLFIVEDPNDPTLSIVKKAILSQSTYDIAAKNSQDALGEITFSPQDSSIQKKFEAELIDALDKAL